MEPNTVIMFFATPFIRGDGNLLIPSSGELNIDDLLSDLINNYEHVSYTGFTWERMGQIVRVPERYDTLKQYNYCCYSNNGKIEFAFIERYQYINNNLTGVYTYVDYWSTYMDKYTFYDSPMLREHPTTDSMFENLWPEPISANRWHVNRVNYGENDATSDNIYVLTANNTSTYEDRQTNFFSALVSFILGSASALSTYFSTIEVTPCNCGGLIQGNTSHTNQNGAKTILQTYSRVGRDSDVIGAYHIPSDFISSSAYDWDATALETAHGTVSLPLTYDSDAISWKKIKYLAQFNRLTVSVCGRTRNYDFELFTDETISGGSINFAWAANQSKLGSVIICPQGYAAETGSTAGEFSIAGPQWDSVQIAVSQANESAIAPTVATGAANVVTSLFDLNIVNGLKNAAAAGLDLAEQGGRILEESDITAGTVTNTITSYQSEFPVISAAHYSPSENDIERINLYFSTFGYNYNSQVAPINLTSMPVMNYVHTASAVVTGELVPQEFLVQMISALNSGVMFWHGAKNFKKTSALSENILSQG